MYMTNSVNKNNICIISSAMFQTKLGPYIGSSMMWDLYINSSTMYQTKVGPVHQQFNDVPNKTGTFTSAVNNVPNNIRALLHNSH